VDVPEPRVGSVIRYAFLWRREAARGQEEGAKDRPCAIVMAAKIQDETHTVIVLPVTHTPPHDAKLAVEIPAQTKKRLGLDAARSWIVLTAANRFLWPGPDLRPAIKGDAASVVYGVLPETLFREVQEKFVRALKTRSAGVVRRTGD